MNTIGLQQKNSSMNTGKGLLQPVLRVVTYHYVRDLPNTTYPRIRGMHVCDFHAQLKMLKSRYEMATLESALDFLKGDYIPSRDLCLLTFDDGLKEHYSEVTPILVDNHVQGLFFVITSCLQNQRVTTVHMNHFLMAALDFTCYQRAFVERLEQTAPDVWASLAVDQTVAQRAYPFDLQEVASFKYLINFVLDWDIRDQVIRALFEQYISDEQGFSLGLYANWKEAREMQTAGMLIGGHSHQHKPLSSLTDAELSGDIEECKRLLEENLNVQTLWPFCYPFGQKHSFNAAAVREIKRAGFVCAFTTANGENLPAVDEFALERVDCTRALA